jgi:IMP dehydrogenase/GMP reductase
MENTKIDFNDILIKPAATSKILTRKKINPFYNGFLPLITAPMDTVIDENNEQVFLDLRVNTCMPRKEKTSEGFNSYSIDEMFSDYLTLSINPKGKYLIDIANGHMENLLWLTKTLKTRYPELTLMVGNIANPETYQLLSEAGADYIRVGIGNGGGCSTTLHTGIGFPMASLIKECREIAKTLNNPAKIVADGGMQSYSDIIKALALGADYVMVGNIFNKAIESCGPNYLFKRIRIPNSLAEWCFKKNIPVYKKFRGMSTKEVQKKWGKTILTTSEGVIRIRRVEYKLSKWIENFEDYLRSAMSYTNTTSLKEFIGGVETIEISNNSYLRFKK